jgi:Phage capsid family
LRQLPRAVPWERRPAALLPASGASTVAVAEAEGKARVSPRYEPRPQRSLHATEPGASAGEIPAGVGASEQPEFLLRGRQQSGIAADPYRQMRQLEDVDEGVSVNSWWRDQLIIADSRVSADRAFAARARRLDGGDPENPAADDELEDAKERLRISRAFAERELRDLSSSGNTFIPAGAAVYVASEFSVAARARASLFDALPQRPLPEFGLKVEVPRLVTGGSVAVVASENSAVSETDPTSALASSARAYLAGNVDVSRQLLELARPGIDQVVSRDLGRDLGLKVDQQLVTGSNAAGQTEGLATVAGTIAITYTAATPTLNKLVSAIWDGARQIAEQGGGPSELTPDNYLVVMAPRRFAYLSANTGSTSGSVTMPPLPGQAVATPGCRTVLGAGTNEDEIYVIAKDEVFVGSTPPMLAIYPEAGSSTLTVRLQARQSVATMFSRQPKAIARISGTGLVSPTF